MVLYIFQPKPGILAPIDGMRMPLEVTSPPVYSENITIVTAFINIAIRPNQRRSSRNTYHRWAEPYSKVHSPVYAFFADDADITKFREIRGSIPASLTKIVKVNLSDTWAFSHYQVIKQTFLNRNMTESESTKKASYSCVMTAKYDFVLQAIRDNAFGTRYFSWMDYGYMRSLVKKSIVKKSIVKKSNSSMSLRLPPQFNRSRVAYTKYGGSFTTKLTMQELISKNRYWYLGGFFLGSYDLLPKMVAQYRSTVTVMIKGGWVGTDEHALYYMQQQACNISRQVDIQQYRPRNNVDFTRLGFLCLGLAS